MVSDKKRTGGFTIVELLIVIVVIGILAAITIVAYNGIQDRARFTKIRADLANTRKAIELFKAQTGNYPDTAGAWKYSANGVNAYIPGLVPDYVSSLPQLSGTVNTNNCYIYQSDGATYKLMRLGQPAIPSGEWSQVSPDMKMGTYTDRWGYL